MRGKKSNKEEFIERAKVVHKDSLNKYFYDKFEYVNNYTKGIITCEKHGDFKQTPANHLSGHGCPKCGGTSKSNSQEFIERAKIVHKDSLYEYNYDKFVYVNALTKSTITCEKHGDFEQKPADHLNGHGCPECKKEKLSNLYKSNLQNFVEKAKKIHKDKYFYDKFVYVNALTKGIITCKKHGNFEQTPAHHLSGYGCTECWKERNRELQNIKWSDRFDEGILYLIECWNDVERFVKIGITSRSVEERYRQFRSMPYQYKVLKEIQMDSKTVSDTEWYIINFYESYKPKIAFGGDSECLEISEKYQIIEFLENLKI